MSRSRALELERCPRGLRVGLWLAGVSIVSAGGCQSYERRPFDLARHHAEFLERSPESPEVRLFAQTLAARSTEHQDAPTLFDPTDGITREEAEVLAVVFNAELRLARLRAGVTRASADEAGLWEDPTLGVDLVRIVESTPEPWKVSVGVGLTIPISGRLGIEKERAGAEHAVELARIAQREWLVRMSVRRAWCEWSAIHAKIAVMRDFVSRISQILSVVDMMEQAGEMTRAEARLFRIEKATKEADLVVLETRARETELALRQLMGLSPSAPLELRSSGVGPMRSTERSTPGLEELERRNPALIVAILEHEVAERSLEYEIRKQYPDLHIGPGLGREDAHEQVLFGLSLPLPILNANRRGIAEASAKRELARAAVGATLEQTMASLHAAEVRLAAASRRRWTLESDVVPLVDAQYSDARALARLGEVHALVLLESLTRQQEAKVGLVEAARDEALAVVELDEIMGPERSGVEVDLRAITGRTQFNGSSGAPRPGVMPSSSPSVEGPGR